MADPVTAKNAAPGGTCAADCWASDILGEVGGELEIIVDRLVRKLDGEALQAAKRALAALKPMMSEPTITTLAHLDVPNDQAQFREEQIKLVDK